MQHNCHFVDAPLSEGHGRDRLAGRGLACVRKARQAPTLKMMIMPIRVSTGDREQIILLTVNMTIEVTLMLTKQIFVYSSDCLLPLATELDRRSQTGQLLSSLVPADKCVDPLLPQSSTMIKRSPSWSCRHKHQTLSDNHECPKLAAETQHALLDHGVQRNVGNPTVDLDCQGLYH